MELVSSLTHLLRQLYSNLLPVPCFLCGNPATQSMLCRHCEAELPQIDRSCTLCAMPLQQGLICGQCLKKPPRHQRAVTAFLYAEPIDRCISAFKYQQQLGFTKLFADKLLSQIQQNAELPDCIIPIPLHPKRLRKRGFNQAHELSKVLSQLLAIPVAMDTLYRVRHTPPQAALPLKQRRRNIKNAFRCKSDSLPARIALVDDVYTTGITLDEAAKTLQRQGAEYIEVWTIARAIRHY